ncbi:hypothetical protein [Chryseobacterium sp. S90]|uniref:hypothetical protein n=1 Tax=Chryseobacterium sp. S90 TaxID=3395373 RepID=UPI0039BC9A90
MNIFKLVILLFFFSCCKKEYLSSYQYDHVEVYEYNKKPWDDAASGNKIYMSRLSKYDNSLYSKIQKMDYSFKESMKPSLKIDSLIFKNKYDYYLPEPTCPAGYNHVLLFYDNMNLKYILKFSEYCNECFLINHMTRKSYYLKIGYEEFMNTLKNSVK